jgi:hypothetical protein
LQNAYYEDYPKETILENEVADKDLSASLGAAPLSYSLPTLEIKFSQIFYLMK